MRKSALCNRERGYTNITHTHKSILYVSFVKEPCFIGAIRKGALCDRKSYRATYTMGTTWGTPIETLRRIWVFFIELFCIRDL